MDPGVNGEPHVAVIVPCYNEEVAIARVVGDLRQALPGAAVYVYDNASTDRTAQVAAEAGAIVRRETRRGKGNVVRRAFADVNADIYAMIDGDDTYDATALPGMVDVLRAECLDHVLGVRTPSDEASAYRPGHASGNRMFNRLVGGLFGEKVGDMLSGCRVMSHRFVKSFPALSREFETETELTIHCMNLRVPQAEVPVGFRDRPAGSESKLRTVHDGVRILRLVAALVQHERPLQFYSIIAGVFALAAIGFAVPMFWGFATTGLARTPTAVLASSLMIVAMLSFVVALVLNALQRARQEAARLAYLRYPAPPPPDSTAIVAD